MKMHETVRTRPHRLARGTQLQHLAHDLALARAADERPDLAKVEPHVLVHGGEVAGLTGERVGGVEEDDRRGGVGADERLQ
jgi:hypothetical protein